MARYDKLVEHLPSLFKPQPGADDLTTLLMQSVGQHMDTISEEMTDIMQAHWYSYADRASFSPYVNRDRERQDLPLLDLTNVDDRKLLEEHPYLLDLARLGSLLALPPWREPMPLRERVEGYRKRLGRFMQMYRNGLGTVDALRAMVELELPADSNLAHAQRERLFSIEENELLNTAVEKFNETRIAPQDMAGPLMRWCFNNKGAASVVPTLYIQGQAPDADTDTTQRPMLEHFDPEGDLFGVGLGYDNTLAEGQTLRLRPVYHSWLGREDGLFQAGSVSTDTIQADPTAAGPWQEVTGSPVGIVTAMHQSADHILWVAVDNGGDASLWRYDGQNWNQVLETVALEQIHCISSLKQELFIGAADGLLTMALYPAAEDDFEVMTLPALSGIPVYAMLKWNEGVWLGTEAGARWMNPDGELVLTPLEGTAIHAIKADQNGVLYFGGTLGLFQYQYSGLPPEGTWYWYKGEEQSDQEPDWEAVTENLPTANQVFLPRVTAIGVSSDASLWIGTENGIARYLARHVKSLSYRTELEACPDLVDGHVFAIEEDARGQMWFATARGLFRYDGRNLAQFQDTDSRWLSQGRADYLYRGDHSPEVRGAWRFNRSLGDPAWERYEGNTAGWQVFNAELRSEEQLAVRVLVWTDSVSADLGSWDGQIFTHSGDANAAELIMRCKPDETRIVAGGIPAVPRMPSGKSVWRYLAMEAENLTPPEVRPWWSTEGRLFPVHDGETPYPGRYGSDLSPESLLDQIVFPYKPAARIWFQWRAPTRFTVLVRLYRMSMNESIHPAILDRVWRGMDRVRPAGVRVILAVEEQIVRGE